VVTVLDGTGGLGPLVASAVQDRHPEPALDEARDDGDPGRASAPDDERPPGHGRSIG